MMNCITYDLSKLPEETIKNVVKYTDHKSSHMLGLAHRIFLKITKSDSRALTYRNAFKSKSYDYIQLVEEKKKQKIDVTKYMESILEMNDITTIIKLIPDSVVFSEKINKYSEKIARTLSPPIIFHLLGEYLDQNIKKILLSGNRIDVINYYLEMGIDIYDEVDPSYMTVDYIHDINFAVFLISRNVPISNDNISKSIFSGNLELVKLLLYMADSDEIEKYWGYEYPYIIDIDKRIVLWIYKFGYNIFKDMYTYAFCTDQLTDFNFTPNPKIHNDLTILHNASKNIFEYLDIALSSNDIYTICHDSNIYDNILAPIKCKILYYMIKYNHNNIRNSTKINTNTIIISNIQHEDCLYDYYSIKKTNDSTNFLSKYIANITHLNTDIIEQIMDLVLLPTYNFSFSISLEYYNLNIRQLFLLFQNTSNRILNKNSVLLLSQDTIIQICESEHINVLFFLINNKIITLKMIVKHCRTPIILPIINRFYANTNNLVNIVIKHGNFEIIKHFIINYKLKRSDILSVIVYCPSLLKFLLINQFSNIKDISYFIIENIIEQEKVSSQIKSKFNDSININLEEKITTYYALVTNLYPSIDDQLINQIIQLDNVRLYKQILSKCPIKRYHIRKMICNNSTQLLQYLGSINQLVVPFRCYSENPVPFISSYESMLTILKEISCECKTDIEEMISNPKFPDGSLAFYNIYNENYKKINDFYKEDKVICLIGHSLELCSTFKYTTPSIENNYFFNSDSEYSYDSNDL